MEKLVYSTVMLICVIFGLEGALATGILGQAFIVISYILPTLAISIYYGYKKIDMGSLYPTLGLVAGLVIVAGFLKDFVDTPLLVGIGHAVTAFTLVQIAGSVGKDIGNHYSKVDTMD